MTDFSHIWQNHSSKQTILSTVANRDLEILTQSCIFQRSAGSVLVARVIFICTTICFHLHIPIKEIPVRLQTGVHIGRLHLSTKHMDRQMTVHIFHKVRSITDYSNWFLTISHLISHTVFNRSWRRLAAISLIRNLRTVCIASGSATSMRSAISLSPGNAKHFETNSCRNLNPRVRFWATAQIKVRGPNSLTYLHQTPIPEWRASGAHI